MKSGSERRSLAVKPRQRLQSFPNSYSYGYPPQETHVAVEANVSVQQSIKIHHHTPLRASAILAVLAAVIALYLGYLSWPYRGLIEVIVLVLIVLAALIGLLRLAWPLIAQIRASRVVRLRGNMPTPHDSFQDYQRGLEPEILSQYTSTHQQERQAQL